MDRRYANERCIRGSNREDNRETGRGMSAVEEAMERGPDELCKYEALLWYQCVATYWTGIMNHRTG